MSQGGAGNLRRAPIRANPIRTRKDWEAAREAAAKDPGAFHGDIARREIYWLANQGDGGGAWVVATPSTHGKCVRCWHFRPDVGIHADDPELCGRCVENVNGAGETRRYF